MPVDPGHRPQHTVRKDNHHGTDCSQALAIMRQVVRVRAVRHACHIGHAASLVEESQYDASLGAERCPSLARSSGVYDVDPVTDDACDLISVLGEVDHVVCTPAKGGRDEDRVATLHQCHQRCPRAPACYFAELGGPLVGARRPPRVAVVRSAHPCPRVALSLARLLHNPSHRGAALRSGSCDTALSQNSGRTCRR